jgi:GNAT superfamily N-acetyltransferase
MTAPTIRPASPDDWPTIVAFNTGLARETERKVLIPHVAEQGVKALLADERHGRYFLAEIDGRVVGQIMHTREWSDWRNGEFWWVQSVYVHPHYRRRGVFRSLMRHLVELARATPGIVGLRLYMADDNLAARRTYESCGFQFDHYVVLERLLSDEHVLPRLPEEEFASSGDEPVHGL